MACPNILPPEVTTYLGNAECGLEAYLRYERGIALLEEITPKDRADARFLYREYDFSHEDVDNLCERTVNRQQVAVPRWYDYLKDVYNVRDQFFSNTE